jgi:cytoskeletal protein CcmA (bactofilin family)
MAIIGGSKQQRAVSEETHLAREVPNPADAHTILGREARFQGKLIFEGAVRIDGRFEGEIVTDDLLLVGPSAEVRAQLHVGSIVINGYVEGDIVAKSLVEIKAPGRLKGNVVTPSLVIEKGVVFDGSCRMSQDRGEVVALPRPD